MATLSSPTFGQLIDQALTYLHGHTADLEQLTALTADVTATDLTLSVSDASQISVGLIEIDSELMWVQSTDQSVNTVTIAAFGRGFRETDAATHTSGTMVTNTPRYPRKAVAEAIQQTIFAVYPDLFAVKTDVSQTTVPVQTAYELPADCDLILDISWQSLGPSQEWIGARRWELDARADTTAFPTGKSVDIHDTMAPGRTIKVTYVGQPGQLGAETDSLSSTGLQDSVSDVLIYGACYRLVGNLDVSRLQTATIEQAERSMLVNPGAALSASKYFFSLYEQALQRESLRLQKFNQTKSHLVR